MKKVKIILIILIGIFLVGCSENDIIEEVIPEEPTEELLSSPDVSLHVGDLTINGTLDRYCWEEGGTTCSLEPTSPKERLKEERPLRVNPEVKVNIIIGTSDPLLFPIELLTPDNIELIQTNKDEKTTIEVENKQFTAPKEEGDYYYSAIFTWDGDQKGQAIYAFSLWVK